MFEWLQALLAPVFESLQVNTSVFFAVCVLVSCVIILALREFSSWFLKTNHIRAEIYALRDELDLVLEKLQTLESRPQKSSKSETDSLGYETEPVYHEKSLRSPLNKKREPDQFPLQ